MKVLYILLFLSSLLFSEQFKLSWYSWDGFSSYQESKYTFFKKLPKATNRIFVSFSPSEIEYIKYAFIAQQDLKDMIREAQDKNMSVSLLLGDPQWVYPKNHNSLISIIEVFKDYNFASLQLDIEPHGLKTYDEDVWIKNISTLLEKVDKKTKLPIGFSLNHNLANKKILKILEDSNVDEIVVMYYSTNSNNLENKLNELMLKNKDLNFSLALSIEPLSVLPKEETYARYPKNDSLQKWQSIYKNLKHHHNFVDIVIQSLHDYKEAR
jgi:hypothetical protein